MSTCSVRRFRLLTPIETRTAVDGARQLVLVVHLDEGREPQLPRALLQAHEIGLLQRRDDQQDGVRAVRTRLEQLVLVDDEVLAQERQAPRRARTAARCSSAPSKNVGSVSTEMAAAPPCS